MKLITVLFLMLMATSSQAQNKADSLDYYNFGEVETFTPTFTQFSFNANAKDGFVRLNIYDSADAKEPSYWTTLLPNGQYNWVIGYDGDLNGKFYTIDAGYGECPGVFATAVSVNGRRGAFIDMKATNPEGWESDTRPPLKSPADLVIYEMHHRDFSIDPSSGIEHKGKFLALTEPKAINHLKELGVNAVHLLPSYDFGSIDETRLQDNKYNWGYDPVNYNVPEGSYSTNPFDPSCRIREFKLMVQALHRAGIRVILDVVYNHTYDIEHSNFQLTYPDYYYRKNADGSYSNGSGCGNETASDKLLMRKFMLESVEYWIKEYHIDGFRFDLMGVHDIETMNLIRKMVDDIDPTIFIYGEGWSAGECAYPQDKLAVKANTRQLDRIAAFSDEIRDALRGPFNDDTKGAFLAGIPGEEESLKFGIVGAIAHPQVDMSKVNYAKEPWANEPTQMISYVSCHDDMCLVDRLKASVFDNFTISQSDNLQSSSNGEPTVAANGEKQVVKSSNSEIVKSSNGQMVKWSNGEMDQLIRLDLLAQTAVFTSQGVPFMLSGEEMLRDKKGVHNSFESPDSINHLDWTNLESYPQVFNYYKNLIALRKHHPAFRLGKAEQVRQHLEFLPTQDCLVAFRLKDHAGGDAWQDIIVILNSSKEPRIVDVPEDKYTVVACDGVINEQGLGTIDGCNVTVDPQSALIIHN